MNNMFNNSNPSDSPVIIKVEKLNSTSFVTTAMPVCDNQQWEDRVRKSYVNPRKVVICDNGIAYTAYGLSEKQLQDYISYGKKPAGTSEYKDSALMRNLFGIFAKKCNK